MKLYGFIRGPLLGLNEGTSTGKFQKDLYHSPKERDDAAEAAVMDNYPHPVYLFELTGIMEVQKPKFMTKGYNKSGELVPE